MSDRDPVPDNHMSDLEALMWNLEKDPTLSSTFANLTMFDVTPDMDRLRERMLAATRAVPRLRQKVVAALGRLAPPEWRDDPDFDVDYHLRRVSLPSPGTQDQLHELAASLAAAPFDRTRPLWEFTIIDGLCDGRGAMVQKMHHTLTDGEGGVRMSVQFIDIERDPPTPLAPTDGPETPVDALSKSLIETARDTVAHSLRRQAGLAQRGIGAAADLIRHPELAVHAPADALDVVRSLSRQAVVTGERLSPLWTDRSLERTFDVHQVPLADARATAKALGGSINDFFVTGAAGGAGAYHRAKGSDVSELRISMPISTRTGKKSGGNSFTPARVVVPVGPDPRQRFSEISARLGVTRHEKALGFTELLAGVVNVLPTSVLVRVTRSQVETVDFTTSNVRGAPWDLYIAGAKLVGNFPLGPVAGTAFNLTTLSCSGSLDMGLHTDPAAVKDPDLLRACMVAAFDELLALA